MSHDHNKRSGNLLTSILANNGGIISAKTRVFEERYSGGVLDMNIFCFAFINENDSLGSVIKVSSVSSKDRAGHSQLNQDAIKEHDEDESLRDAAREASQSATGSSSSMKDSSASMTEFRNFHSFTEQATPKTLTLILKLIVALYLIMVTVASINLGININRQV